MLVGDIVKHNARLYRERIAVAEGSFQHSFCELNIRVNKLANALISLGCQKNDKVAVLNHNCYQYIELYFALAKAGMPIVPLNFRFAKDELVYVINHSEARVLFFGSKYLPVVEEAREDLENIDLFICIDDELQGFRNYEKIIENGGEKEPDIEVKEDDLVILGYTGGTTGLPKGVMTSHKNLISSCYNCAVEIKTSGRPVYLNAPPLFHAGDAMGMFAFSFLGGTNVVMPSFTPEQAFAHIENFKVTHPLFVPAMILFMLQSPDIGKFDLSSLQTVLYGTAPMPIELLKKAMAAFKCDFLQIYGATETFVPISMLKPEDHVQEGDEAALRRMESAGREVIGVEAKVVDYRGNDLGQGETGELIVKGGNVMKGYWKQPELSKEVLDNGWYYTGDMGRLDERNYIYIVDRKKDMIISGGENIYPKEVENILLGHPAVQEAAVIGIPNETWGEEVKALVILNKNMQTTQDELIEYCKARLAGYKCPRTIDLVEEFPRSSAGKILKRELREKFWQDQDKQI